MDLHGKFIVLDGPDGSGKGTQLERLATWLAAEGFDCLRTRDPGGTEIGDRIRHVLLGFDLSKMAPHCEALLFMASRAQLVAEVVRPALARGQTVLCDRFISATCAYQVAAGYARKDVLALGQLAVADTWPNLTILLDLPPEVGFERTGRRPHHIGQRARNGAAGQGALFEGTAPDAMERRPLEFHRRVRELFHELPDVYPAPVVMVAADQEPEAVFADVQDAVRRVFP
ncbi:MAG: dTMP kinase [Phycisphaerae bacterium]|jgi:dTMP kinase